MEELFRILINDPSCVGEARRLAVPICRLLNFTAIDIGMVSLIVTEMATNLSKHAGGGEIILRSLESGGVGGIEMLAIDKGPGIANVGRSLQDGFSTAGSPGAGLGIIIRSSSLFDIYSEPGKGTIVLSRYWARDIRKQLPFRPLEIGAVSLPMPGEDFCGDGWAVEQTEQKSLVFVADGLGHGARASEASQEAIRLLRKNKAASPLAIIEALHVGLKSTRGASIAVAQIDHVDHAVRYAGIGNIAGRIAGSDGEKSMVSHNGTAGHEVRKIQEFAYPWDDENILIMNSDGLMTGVKLTSYQQLVNRHPTIIAALLYRDYARSRDDATVVVAKKRRHE